MMFEKFRSTVVWEWLSDQYHWHLADKINRGIDYIAKPFREKKNISGKGNRMFLNTNRIKSVRYIIHGDNNLIEISAKSRFGKVSFEVIGDFNHVLIHDEAFIEGASFHLIGDYSRIEIGKGTYVAGAAFIAAESRTRIQLGECCMLANEIQIRTGDSHGIFDRATGARLNKGADIQIGNRVWLANRVIILKGVTIPDGCIVGAGTIAAKSLDSPNAVYAGQPPRKVKENVEWRWGLETSSR